MEELAEFLWALPGLHPLMERVTKKTLAAYVAPEGYWTEEFEAQRRFYLSMNDKQFCSLVTSLQSRTRIAKEACFDCGGDVEVAWRRADGVCMNCGPVAIDILKNDGKIIEGFSVRSWIEDLAQMTGRPASYFDPDNQYCKSERNIR